MRFPLQRSLLRVGGVTAWRAAGVAVCFAIFLSVGSIASAQRRDFPASYSITRVAAGQSTVELTLTLTLRNYSGRDVDDCGIVLDSSEPVAEPIGNFDLIPALPSYGEVTVRHRFTVTQAEYARWQQGVEPALEILIPDGRGGTRIDRIDARREAPLADPAG